MVDIVTRLGKGSPLTNAEVDANFTNLAEVSGVTGEPMGHEDRTTSTISFNASTRTFTITPVASSFTVWCKGKKVVVSTAQTVTIPNTTGMYSIYYDANGVLSAKSGYFTFSLEAPTAYVYWNAATGTAPYFGDERHGVVLDWQTHEYLHRTRGAALASGFSASGYVLGGNGSLNSHAQLTIEGGTFFDEDMKIIVTATNTPTAGTWEQDLTSPARIPVLYLSGTAWVIDSPTDYPLKQGTARPQYNAYSGGVWSTADVTNNKYATSWILATNNLTYPVIAIIGQAQSDSQSDAEAVDFTELQLPGFPSVEFRPLYKLIFQCADSCTNAVHASLVSITDIRSIAAAGTAASIVTDHGNLSGLSDDDHPQYIHVDTLRTVSAAVKASFLPSQTSNAGKFLQTDGTATSWQALTSGNVTTALGFTPYNATNPNGYITGISSSDVTTALGFTPYNATNPSGYVTAAGARGAISVTGAGSYDSATGVINIVGGVTSFNTRTGAITLSSADVTTALGFTPYNNTNPSGYITGITSTMVTTALGYTPYNSSNPNGYISSITSANVTTALGFTPYNATNPSGYITSSALSGYLTSASAASTYLPLSGGTVSGQLVIGAVGTANSPTLRLNTSSSGAFVHTQETFAANLTSGQHIISVIGKVGSTKNSGYIGYTWAGDASNSNYVTIGHWGNDDLLRVYGDGNVTVGTNTVLHAGNYNSYALPLSGGTLTGVLNISNGDSSYVTFGPNSTYSGSLRVGTGVGPLGLVSGRATIYSDNGNLKVDAGTGQTLYLNQHNGGGTVYIGGTTNYIIHTGNYNSFAPTLTGGGASGTWGINVTGSSGSSTTSTYVTSQDIRALSPSSTAAFRQGFGFTSWANNNSAPYADYLALRSYTDASGGNDNLVMFNKSTIAMRVWQQGWGSASAYASYADVLMSNNYSSYALPLSGGTMGGSISFAQGANINFGTSTTESGPWTISVIGSGGATPATKGTGRGRNLIIQAGASDNGAGLAGGDMFVRGGNPTSPSVVYGDVRLADLGGQVYLRSGEIALGSSNYSSYALPLSGGTVTGQVVSSANGNQLRFVRADGTTPNWTFHGWGGGLNIYSSAVSTLYIGRDGPGTSLDVYNGSLTQAGNQVLHAGNYTSYSPALTGTGASGTWGINVTGTSAKTGANSGYTRVGYGMAAFYNWGGANAGSGAPSDSTYTTGIDVGSHPSDQAYGFQIASNMWNVGLWTRTYNSGFSSWVRILDSSNYSSYALPLSGGELSGSLRINTSGSGSTTSHVIIKRSGQTPASFGSYSGSWRSSLEIWNNDSTKMLFLNSAENDSGYANIKSVGGGFFIDVGSNGATRAIQIEASGAANFPQSLTQGGNQVLHASNWTNYVQLPYTGWPGYPGTDANTFLGGSWVRTSFTYSNNAPLTGTIATFPSSGYDLQLNANYNGHDLYFRSRNGDAGSWMSWKRVLTDNNYTSYSPSLTGSGASGTWGISVTGNAATAGGLAVHDTQGTQNSANQIVRTQVNGYTMLGWINTTSGDSGIENRLTRIYSSNDGYVRYSTLTDFKVHMGLSAKNSYSRRIDYTSDANYHVGSMGHSGYGANETFHGGSGFIDIWSGTNYPPSTSHIHGFNALHYTTNSLGSTGGNAYGIQVVGQYDQGGLLFSRGCNGGSFSAWRRQLDDNNYNSYAPTLTGGNASGTWGISVTGSSKFFKYDDGPRNLSDRPPNWNNRSVIFDFVGAGTGNGAGNYAGVLTFVPWDGTSASTGDSSYQLSFANQSGVNASGPARLSIRNGINSSWNGWQTILSSSNYDSYTVNRGGDTLTGLWYFRSNRNTSSDSPPLQAFSNDGGGAIMSFHRGGYYAVNFGLDSDNVIRIGGWSASTNRLQMDMSGNLTMAGNVTAYSDERLKKDWAALPSDFVERLAKIKAGTYTRIDSEERQAGVSAQDWQKLLPETVSTDNEGTLSLAYGNAALVSAVELAKEVVDLRTRVAQLESLINKLIGD